jgi:hypothetical protein
MLVLVADDHPLVREGLRRLLFRAGFEVVEAENGEEAIRKAEELGPSLVLWDLLMPGGGLEGLRRLREKVPEGENFGPHRIGHARARGRGSPGRRPRPCGENRGSGGDFAGHPRHPPRGNPGSFGRKPHRAGGGDPPDFWRKACGWRKSPKNWGSPQRRWNPTWST